MEFTTVASVLLAATAAIAAPTTANAKRAQSLQIKNFSVRLASTVNMGMLELVLYDPNSPTVNGTNPTGCNANWEPGRPVPTDTMVSCVGGAYQVGFPSGLDNIENFTLKVVKADGSEEGQADINASAPNSDWVCTKIPSEGD